MDSKIFIEFLEKPHKDADQAIFEITDNTRYHHGNSTQSFIKKQEGAIKVMFLPAHSPELNPDKQVWSHTEVRLSKRSTFTKDDVKTG